MTKLISHFTITVGSKRDTLLKFLSLLRNVEEALEMGEGAILVLLNPPMRYDAEDFGALNDALSGIAEIHSITKGVWSNDETMEINVLSLPIVEQATEAVRAMKPSIPTRPDNAYEVNEFLRQYRAWKRATYIFDDAADKATSGLTKQRMGIDRMGLL